MSKSLVIVESPAKAKSIGKYLGKDYVVEASIGQAGTGEVAVMVDTFRPLRLGPAAVASEDTAYSWTWSRAR